MIFVPQRIIKASNETKKIDEIALQQVKVLKKLREKDVVYVKADKSNNVVIIDKIDYNDRVDELITECQYREITRNPLKKMIREANLLRQKIKKVFSDRVCRALLVSNPTLPKLYALPKTHKPGNKMRPIVSIRCVQYK